MEALDRKIAPQNDNVVSALKKQKKASRSSDHASRMISLWNVVLRAKSIASRATTQSHPKLVFGGFSGRKFAVFLLKLAC